MISGFRAPTVWWGMPIYLHEPCKSLVHILFPSLPPAKFPFVLGMPILEPMFKRDWDGIQYSVVQSQPFDLLVSPFWSIFSKGPKRFTFYFRAFWATESMLGDAHLVFRSSPLHLSSLRAQEGGAARQRARASSGGGPRGPSRRRDLRRI